MFELMSYLCYVIYNIYIFLKIMLQNENFVINLDERKIKKKNEYASAKSR